MSREPTLQELISDAIESKLLDVHTGMPGIVVKYYADKFSADVQPAINQAVPRRDGTFASKKLPVIHNVPVCFFGGQKATMHFHLVAGDEVQLSFSEAAMSKWRATGEISDPGDVRRFDLTYACAYPGLRSLKNLPTPGGANEVVLELASGVTFRVGADPAVFVGDATKILAELNRVKADLTTLKAAILTALGSIDASLAATSTAPAFTTATSAIPSSPASVAVKTLKAEPT